MRYSSFHLSALLSQNVFLSTVDNHNKFYTSLFLLQELELYNEELVNKPAVLILNKLDIDGADKLFSSTVERFEHVKGQLYPVLVILSTQPLTFGHFVNSWHLVKQADESCELLAFLVYSN